MTSDQAALLHKAPESLRAARILEKEGLHDFAVLRGGIDCVGTGTVFLQAFGCRGKPLVSDVRKQASCRSNFIGICSMAKIAAMLVIMTLGRGCWALRRRNRSGTHRNFWIWLSDSLGLFHQGSGGNPDAGHDRPGKWGES